MLDKFGNVMGIVVMKSANSQFEDSFGMAISAGKVRKFLDKNKIVVTAGDVAGAAECGGNRRQSQTCSGVHYLHGTRERVSFP